MNTSMNIRKLSRRASEYLGKFPRTEFPCEKKENVLARGQFGREPYIL